MPHREPVWVPRLVVEAVHFDQIREHGGMPGLRDADALESSLARPRHRWHYDRTADLAVLATAYGYGIVRNHPFNDGNKRTAFLAMAVFLGLNARALDANDEEIVALMTGLAADICTEEDLTLWLRSRLVPEPKKPRRR